MYTVPGACVTKQTRFWIWKNTPNELVVFGGPGAVSAAAANLTACG
jgi:hypothetical protein